MSRNEVFRDADHLSLPVPAGIVTGEPVRVGDLVGVTETGEGEGRNAEGYASVALHGAFDLVVDGAVSEVGGRVYITAGRTLTTTATGNFGFGFALETKGAGAGVVPVVVWRNPPRFPA